MSIEIKARDLEGRQDRVRDLFRLWCKTHDIRPSVRDVFNVCKNVRDSIQQKNGVWYESSDWKFLIRVDKKKSGEYVMMWGYRPGVHREEDNEMDRDFCQGAMKYAGRQGIEAINPYKRIPISQYFSDIK